MAESKSFAQPLSDLDDQRDTDAQDGPTEGPDMTFGGVPIPTPSSEIPERVRFAVPAVLSFDGYEETFDVAILNLSANGVACTGPQGLAVRDRLRLNFRLSLSSHPRSFLCEVIWVQATGNDEANYGLRFVDLDADLATHVLDTVRERVEGRASEWAMPILPGPAEDDFLAEPRPSVTEPPGRGWRQIWLAAAAGMAAGIGLCLVIAAVTATVEDPRAAAPAATAPAANAPAPAKLPLHPVVSPTPSPTPASKAEASAPAVSPAPGSKAEASAPTVSPAPTPAIRQSAPAPAPAPSATVTPKAEAPDDSAAPSKPALVLSQPTGVQLEVHSGGRASLVLPLNGPPAQKELFWLNNPTRLVVDVAGRQSALTHGVYELDSPYVSRVRVGHHPGKVRFVIETGKSVSTKATAQAQGNRLRVELQAQR